MFDSEAVRVRELLLEAGAGEISPLLNVGSSTAAFRTHDKPHIEGELFAPLRALGVSVCHQDRKAADGVDVVGDIFDPALQRELAGRGFRCLLLCNVLEHVRDRAALAAACEAIVGPGGLILATVPASFPFHADPIDTGYRPAPDELARLFAKSSAVRTELVEGPTYRERMRQRGVTPAGELARTVLWLLAAPFRPKSARARLSRWRWYGRPYRVSIALVRVG
jgi:hypothetical protein